MTLNKGKEWQTVRLCDIADIERKGIDPADIKSGTLYVGLEHITGEGHFINVAKVSNGELASTKFVFNRHHVLYGKLRPYLRKIARPSFVGVCSTDILPILPKRSVDRDYLYHYLRQPKMVNLATARSTGANLPRISPKVLDEFEILLPPLDEQRRIATVLDKADALRDKRRLSLNKLDELLKAAFLNVFGDPLINSKGWNKVKLGDIAKRIVVGHVGPTSHGYSERGIPFLRTQNVRPLRINRKELQRINPEFHSKLKKSTVHTGDVLISRVGANRGMAAVVPEDLNEANCANIIVITPGKAITPEFLAYLTNSNYGQKDLLGVSVGSAQGVINTASIKEWRVLLPPIELQQSFSNVVKGIAALSEKFEEHYTLAEDLFASIQHRAFTGELLSGKETMTALVKKTVTTSQPELFD